jgi:solute carrier family 45 protein 3
VPNSPAQRVPPTLLQLLLVNAVVCGSELCISAGFTYLPPMLLKAGVQDQYMSIFLSLGPLLAFFFVPHIARASDNCRSRFGRRRPFILLLGIGVCLSLIIIPYGEHFASLLFQNYSWNKYTGIFLLVAGTVLLDFSAQACLTPCEALLSDVGRDSGSSARAFIVYSFMASVGGCIGYLITALDWSSSPVAALFGGQEKTCFSVLFFLFILTLFASLVVAQESQYTDNPDVPIHETNGAVKALTIAEIIKSGANNTKFDLGYESLSNHSDEADGDKSADKFPFEPTASDAKNVKSVRHNLQNSKRRAHPYLPSILTADRCGVPLQLRILKKLSYFVQHIAVGIYHRLPWTIRNLVESPSILKRLALADFFSWSAILVFNIYFSDFVGQHVYHGNPNSLEGSESRRAYDYGVRISSWGLLLHCLLAAVGSAFIEKMIIRFGSKQTCLFGTMSFTLALTVMVFSTNIFMVNLMATVTGFSVTVITTIPYTLISLYQEDKEVGTFLSTGCIKKAKGNQIPRGFTAGLDILIHSLRAATRYTFVSGKTKLLSRA